MVPFDIDYQQTLGSPFISFIELSMLNEHYGCKDNTFEDLAPWRVESQNCDKTTSVKCEMGGFPHPRDCQRCICPGGYGGKLDTKHWYYHSIEYCGLRALDKGTHRRVMSKKTLRHSPNGTEIEVKLVNFTKGLLLTDAAYAGVEIKTNEDQTLTGYRFCSPDAAGTILRSYINRVPIMTYNRIVKTTTLPLSCTEWFLQGYTIGGYQEESVSKVMWLL
ncbi:hypothetical protein COOONC_25361 [Cooperia oncophora]